jgi:hypothetical protein
MMGFAEHDFVRGAASYQRLLGDENFSPNPCIGKISVAPFYAVKIIPGDIATYHGLVTDERTRVLDVQRKPIAGCSPSATTPPPSSAAAIPAPAPRSGRR